ARLDSRVLLAHALGQARAFLAGHPEYAPDRQQQSRYHDYLVRRSKGEPIAYIVGEKEFCGLTFKVGPGVLVPRPESELLVELALRHCSPADDIRILDLGSGSGVLAVALAKRLPQAHLVAAELSDAALEVMRENVRRLNTRNVSVVKSDWFGSLHHERFNIMVANPPYIAAGDEHLPPLHYEPSAALLAPGVDGLGCIRHIVRNAPTHLYKKGWLFLEHGYNQALACRALLDENGFSEVASVADLAGIPRVSCGCMA
ncbi:MAG: peptide chain release factor N(5)-glutamine methyltransferase, partial [Burkholderiales bacterium]